MTHSKFKIGDRVMIKPTSMWYGKGYGNPADVSGIILDFLQGATIKWDDGSIGEFFADGHLMYAVEGLVLQDSKNSRIVTTNSI